MDNSDIYEYRFEELISIMRRDKEMSAPDGAQSFEGFRDDYVIDIAGNAFRDYQVWSGPTKAGQCIRSRESS